MTRIQPIDLLEKIQLIQGDLKQSYIPELLAHIYGELFEIRHALQDICGKMPEPEKEQK